MRTGNGTNYAELKRNEIETIQRIEMALQSSIIAQGELIPFSVGQTVRFTSANLWALEGKIKAIDGKRRIVVTVKLFNTLTDMTVPATEIEAV
jgi:transcription antitermination factor NusG